MNIPTSMWICKWRFFRLYLAFPAWWALSFHGFSSEGLSECHIPISILQLITYHTQCDISLFSICRNSLPYVTSAFTGCGILVLSLAYSFSCLYIGILVSLLCWALLPFLISGYVPSPPDPIDQWCLTERERLGRIPWACLFLGYSMDFPRH